MDSTPIVVAAVAGVPSVTAAVFAWRSSASANRATQEANTIAKAKVDAEAYERGKAFYDSLVNTQQAQIDRQQRQIDDLTEQNENLIRRLRELELKTGNATSEDR